MKTLNNFFVFNLEGSNPQQEVDEIIVKYELKTQFKKFFKKFEN